MKAIKGVDERTWQEFKLLAVKENVPMGKLFEEMLGFYKRKSEKSWHNILHHKKILSDEEAKKMHEVVKELRSEYGFRE